MGVFDLLDFSSHIHLLLPTRLSCMFTAPKEVEQNVSPNLTKLCRTPTFSSRPNPVPMPLEVVLCILEAAFYENNEPDKHLLKNCALVCRAWSGMAQELLFRHVTLRTQTAYDSFRNAVNRSTERGRILGDAVIRMRVVVDYNQPYGLSQHSFGLAFTLCPNLYELNLALYGCAAPGEDIIGSPDVSRMRRAAPSFDEQTLALLRSGPSITALQFSNWSENQQSIVQLLDIWPSLKFLAISGTPPQAPTTTIPFACSLEGLRMNFQSQPSVDFMSWLLHNSRDTLRILDLGREPSTQLLDYLVGVHGETLHSLSLPSCATLDHVIAISKCQQLKELRVESPGILPKLYKKLPQSLVHLAFGLDQNTALQLAIETVRCGSSIRTVTLNLWDGGKHHPQLSPFKMACAYQGIELRVTTDIQTFRAITKGDPISSQSFPRTISLDTLRMMHP